MWLTDSSIGRKLVMSITGTCLVLFLLFHASMNLTLIFSEDAYNWICQMLGANWYALVGTAGLAFLVLVHFIYAFWLTIQNRRARGNDRYAINDRQKGVDWESQNMLVLGICVIGFLVLHLLNFWLKMQFQEITGMKIGAFDPQDGASLVKYTFTGLYDPAKAINGEPAMAGWMHPVICVLYLVWLPPDSRHLVSTSDDGLEQQHLVAAYQGDRQCDCYYRSVDVCCSGILFPRHVYWCSNGLTLND